MDHATLVYITKKNCQQEEPGAPKPTILTSGYRRDLGSLKRVSGVTTQGRNTEHSQWVTKFTVQYSEDGKTWNNVNDVNGQKVRI